MDGWAGVGMGKRGRERDGRAYEGWGRGWGGRGAAWVVSPRDKLRSGAHGAQPVPATCLTPHKVDAHMADVQNLA